MPKTLLALALSIALPGNVAAVDFSGVDLKPYLVVSRSHSGTSYQPFFLEYQENQSWFITRGGAVFWTLSAQWYDHPPQSRISRGVATAAQLARFRDRLNEAKIRGLASCEYVNGEGFQDRIHVTWYGARGRRNDFTVVIDGDGSTGLPLCGASIEAVIIAFYELGFQVWANPGTECLSQP